MEYIKLTDEIKIVGRTTLIRVELAKDCVYGNKGDKGGWIQNPVNIHESVWIADDAQLLENAILRGNAVLKDNAIASGNCRIEDNAIISGNAHIQGKSRVHEKAQVMGNVIVKDQAEVRGDTILKDDVVMWGKSKVFSGTWIESPFQAQGPVHFVSQSRPASLYIGCIEKSFIGWITGGYRVAQKYNAYKNNEYVNYENMIQPIIESYIKYCEDNWDDLGLAQKAQYKIVEVAGKAYLAGKDADPFTRN
tara:strand:- start:2725 stop:3471 length:747 start_codon:yes stop_codon:yes gene_type:complete